MNLQSKRCIYVSGLFHILPEYAIFLRQPSNVQKSKFEIRIGGSKIAISRQKLITFSYLALHNGYFN